MRSSSSKKSPWTYALIAAPLMMASPTVAKTKNVLDEEALAVAGNTFVSCVDNTMKGNSGNALPYLQSVETCKGVLPRGTTIEISESGPPKIRFNPQKKVPPVVLASRAAFFSCAVETIAQRQSKPKKADVIAMVRSCEIKYYPAKDGSHPVVGVDENGYTILIVPNDLGKRLPVLRQELKI